MWTYAKLSKLAHSCGGPENLVEKLINSGVKRGRIQMIPIVVLALLIGLSIKPLIEYLKNKFSQSNAEFEKAKAELIQGIKDYDAAHLKKDD